MKSHNPRAGGSNRSRPWPGQVPKGSLDGSRPRHQTFLSRISSHEGSTVLEAPVLSARHRATKAICSLVPSRRMAGRRLGQVAHDITFGRQRHRHEASETVRRLCPLSARGAVQAEEGFMAPRVWHRLRETLDRAIRCHVLTRLGGRMWPHAAVSQPGEGRGRQAGPCSAHRGRLGRRRADDHWAVYLDGPYRPSINRAMPVSSHLARRPIVGQGVHRALLTISRAARRFCTVRAIVVP